MNLFHSSHHISHMFDYMNGAHLTEGAFGKWERVLVEVGDYIGATIQVPVDSNGTRVFVDAAAYIQNRQQKKVWPPGN